MKAIISVIVAVLVVACCPCRKVYTATQHDSIRIEYRERIIGTMRDTTIFVEIERERVSEVADSTSHLETAFAVSEASIIGGRLRHTLEQKKQAIEKPIKIPEKEIYRDSVIYRDREAVKVQEVYVLRWWQKILCWIGGLSLGIIAIRISYKLGKII